MNSLLNKYDTHFPEIDTLYDYQQEVLEKLKNSQNTLAIIPTGGGKSLIFQLFSLELTGITIVISPLLALMKEQVDELNKRGIEALAFNSEIPFKEQRNILRNLKKSDFKLLYLAPERLQNSIFRACLAASGIEISMIVIDEAHCISQWGNGFRPDYSQITSFIQFVNTLKNNPTILALTATLAKAPRRDIIAEFNIHENNIALSKKIMRDNLVSLFTKVKNENFKAEELEQYLKKYNLKKALAYLYSKRECENYAELFKTKGYETAFFHSGLSKEEKSSVYNSFLNGAINILFATTAFGMGINIPNIDAVIHIHIPNSVEEYYQHIGRGWRDKTQLKQCMCLALWSDTNFDRRTDEIVKEKFDIDRLEHGFKQLFGKVKTPGQTVSKNKEDFLSSTEKLQLLRYKFEERGLSETIGEINGSPQSIVLETNTELWERILLASEDFDSFIYASKITGISVKEILDHLYEQELLGNIKKLPAMKRDIFFKVNQESIPESIANEIIHDINQSIDLRIKELNILKTLFTSKDPEKVIQQILT